MSTFETCVVVGTWGCLGDAVSCRSPLSSPLVRGPGATEVHGNGSIVERRRGSRQVYRGCPVSDRVSVCRGVWWSPSPHGLLGTLEELLRLPSLLGCIPPVPCIRPSRVPLVAEHALDNLTGPGGVDGFLFHFLIPGRERGLHHFGGNGSGESSEEEVGAFVVPCGIFGQAEQFLK